MMLKAKVLVALMMLMALLPACDRGHGGGAPAASGSAKRLRIAVIPKGTTHEFWKAVHAGAVKAARAAGAEVIWKGPLKEDDLKQQIDLVQSFTAQGVDGIVLAPLNDKALVKAVQGATRSKVPVVIIDSALAGRDQVSFVATDNLVAGKLAGKRMVELLGGKGTVVMLRYQEGSASTARREQGFVDAVRAKPGVVMLSDNQYGGATTETSFAAAESLLLAQRAADGRVGGVFCPNESTTFGMLLALRKLGLAGKVHFIGFDASDKLVAALGERHIDGLVLQDPFTMGQLGVSTLLAHLRGEKVAAVIDTGSRLVDHDNMKQPEMDRLLHPKLGKWLSE